MKSVLFSSRASLKLEELLEYLENEWSLKVKLKFIDRLDEVLKLISEMPASFPRSHKKKGVHKCVITKQTSLFYRVKDKEIEVITLFDNRQSPQKLKL